ncbi:bifunctional methylenetetrahydrofolate dehydrogenase/methenyltetrahydrofolate cyclohydrolase [Patescibacteria group bacterium]|nr:bifunctional methylenetetrahydrofolate dehydrogenase/methenyltetrahydrofolate cyclohydrolase [Patescibacteria group bacterium]
MATIVDGKQIASTILQGLKPRVESIKERGGRPALAVVLVGNDKPSHTYVKKKEKSAQEIGIDFFKFELPTGISKKSLISEIQKVQSENQLSGLIIQLPLPQPLTDDTREIVNQINQDIDVDCLTYQSLGRVMMGVNQLTPPTPSAILEILKHHRVDLKGKYVVLIGRGNLIGRPLASMLMHEPVTLTVCGKECRDLSSYTKAADIIITGVGKSNILTGEMVKEGAVIIDAGVCFDGEKMSGDVDFETVEPKASLITPVPGGVGPITVAKLLENTVINAEAAVILDPERA